MQLRKATRKQAKIRLGLSAVSGGGKTFSAILIAKGLVGGDLSKVAIIDTENGSADLYAHMGEFNVLPLTAPYTPERYVEAIKLCEKSGMEAIIIDSISHEWEGPGGCLEIKDSLGGKYQDWAKVTPRHQKFIDSILTSPCHIITTVRRKQDYEMVKDNSGKVSVEKAGLKEQTREGFEYELTINLEIDVRHNALASKDRTGLFMGKPEFTPNEKTGELIRAWCDSGLSADELARQDLLSELMDCETVKDTVALYNKYKALVDENPDLQAALASKRDELKPATAATTEDAGKHTTEPAT